MLCLCLWLSSCVKRRCHWSHQELVSHPPIRPVRDEDRPITHQLQPQGGGGGGVKEVADDRETLNRTVLTGMACCPFPINSWIFVVEWIRLPLRRFPALQLVFTLSIKTLVMPLMRHLNWINIKLSSSEIELSTLTFSSTPKSHSQIILSQKGGFVWDTIYLPFSSMYRC